MRHCLPGFTVAKHAPLASIIHHEQPSESEAAHAALIIPVLSVLPGHAVKWPPRPACSSHSASSHHACICMLVLCVTYVGSSAGNMGHLVQYVASHVVGYIYSFFLFVAPARVTLDEHIQALTGLPWLHTACFYILAGGRRRCIYIWDASFNIRSNFIRTVLDC